jgi:chromosome segregation ATPase
MSAQLTELETIMQQLIAEHAKLLRQLESQQAAMKNLDLRAMEDMAHNQEATRLRIATLDSRRRAVVSRLAKALNLPDQPTIAKLADTVPQARPRLLALRDQLKALIAQVASRAHVAGRLAGAVLGHLNTVVRLLAGAVEQAGLYTKHGVPQVSARIGVLEAIG